MTDAIPGRSAHTRTETSAPPAHKSPQHVVPSDAPARLAHLKAELHVVTQAAEAARVEGQPGRLFFLLRKKWKLTQAIFEAESEVRLEQGRGEPKG